MEYRTFTIFFFSTYDMVYFDTEKAVAIALQHISTKNFENKKPIWPRRRPLLNAEIQKL